METATAKNPLDIYFGSRLNDLKTNQENGALVLSFVDGDSQRGKLSILPHRVRDANVPTEARIFLNVDYLPDNSSDYSTVDSGPLPSFLGMKLVKSEMQDDALRLHFEGREGLDQSVLEITPHLELVGFSSSHGSYYVRGVKAVLLHDNHYR